MAKRVKKSAEPKAAEPQHPAETTELNQPTQDPLPQEKSEAELDKEAEHRMQAESPALPSDAEAEAEVEAMAADTFEDAYDSPLHKGEKSAPAPDNENKNESEEPESDAENEPAATGGEDETGESAPPRPPAKLERLQKILAQAGVASRRRAEELIEQGRVQVNGKIVTALGTKADAERDHIRVDGKLLHGAERHRYFVLNKPKGYVTTVKDPEGRPTVMQFFEKLPERLYPVGRLDYQTEGLLLVTNDGELANKLTKASSGVEKTYLVKVSGQPTEAELDLLRGGVAIEKGKHGEGRVRTAPARIRQVRQGDNPWYEVVLIEGRNRELRKMFEEIGHFVEKIRRVGYGPLVLDQEPGKLRELEPEELVALRKAADGTLRTPKAKEIRRRNAADSGHLPTVSPRPSRPRTAPQAPDRSPRNRPSQNRPSQDRQSQYPQAQERQTGPGRAGTAQHAGPAPQRFGAGRPAAGKFAPGRPGAGKPGSSQFGAGKPAPGKFATPRPAWKKDDRTTPPPARFNAGQGGEDRRGVYRGGASGSGSAGRGRTGGARPFAAKPAWNKTGAGSDRPPFQRPAGTRRDVPPPSAASGEKRPPRLHIEAVESERPRFDKPRFDRSKFEGTGPRRPGAPPRSGARPSGSARPPRGDSGMARPFTTSSGIPRAGGARPSSKPGKPAGRSYTGRSASGPASGASGTRPAGKTGWKPKSNFGSKPGGKFSGPRHGSGHKSGPRSGGKRS